MKYIVSFLSVCCFVGALFSLGVFADVGNTLKDFKERQKILLFESDYGDIDSEDISIFSLSKRADLFGSIAQNVGEKISATEQKQRALLTEILTLEQSLTEIEEDIEKTKNRVESINATIINIKNQVQANKNTIQLLKKKIDSNREILYKYMVYIYKKSNYFSDEEDIDAIKSILLSGGDVSTLINDLYFKGIIQVTGQKLIEQHRQYVSDLYIKRISLEKQEDNLKKLRKLGIIESKSLQDKRDFQRNILEQSKGQDSLYQRYIDDKVEIEKQLKVKAFQEQLKLNSIRRKLLEKYNCDFVDLSEPSVQEGTLTDACLTLNKIIYSESQLESFSQLEQNIFAWPASPTYGITAYFRDDEYKAQFGDDHDALDIRLPQGSSIRAAAEGYVTFIQVPESPDYAFVAVKHADGFTTVYGHVSEVLVQELDFVEKGQVIAKSGGEVGTYGAGYLSTGPHLHFEVFQNKEFVDPLNFLDTSYISFNSLPERYQFKFYTDFKLRKGYEYSRAETNTGGRTFRIEGETETERQQNFIQTYAAPAFRNWDMWVEESLDGNVDPTFVMCLGLAESGLGRNLKTPYNVGNVGNTDSGAVKAYPNARSGVYWVVRTLNNRFLGQYDTIDKLSCYGNTRAKLCDSNNPVGHYVYASSPDSWHSNVTKCMSHIKGRFVPDNYEFRLLQ
ncbi:peptidoglycan DD-metalloendopeptidase family protein [Candidatus Gracilibacteria bacterium]|nr:peptidoglycan DD-metalloendopeptidase family protein [Candidatus Gracilibacteria bacterium]